MVEAFAAVGLAASIVTFVDVSTKVLARLSEFHSTANEAPGVFRDITTQLPLIVDIMTRIEKGCEDGSLTTDTQKALLPVVKGCLRQITMLNGLIEEMLPVSTDSTLRRARKAIASIRKEKEVVVVQRILETYKSTLTLHFSQRTEPSITTDARENAYYDIPSLQVSHFVARVELLKEIEASFANTTGNTRRPKTVVLRGMGGQGKSQLALEYCRVAKTSGRFQAIFWIDASSPHTVFRGFEMVAAKISGAGRVFEDIESKIAFVRETLVQRESPWLMVFDNYDQPNEFKDITAYLPQGETGAILFTSRHADTERLGVTIRVTQMTEDEGLELLLLQSKRERNDENAKEGRKIVQKLGYLPLAIDHAGAYINARELPLGLFPKHYDERKEFILKHTPSLWEYRRKLGEDKSDTLLSVFTTWELSFQQIGKNEDERTMIGHFLTLSAFFDTTSVGEDLFRSHLASMDKPPQWMEHLICSGVWDQYRYQDVVVELQSLSLLQSVDIGIAGSRSKKLEESGKSQWRWQLSIFSPSKTSTDPSIIRVLLTNHIL